MLSIKEKITIRQAMILYITLLYSPAIRFFPGMAASEGKQAGWLTPLISFLFLSLLILIFHSFYKKNKNASFMDIICKITGKFFGNVILMAYAIWLILLLGLYIRYYAIRVNTVISPITDISLFIIVMLLLVAVVLRYGLAVFTRMSEVIFLILLIGFILLFVFSFQNIKIDNLTPISYLDILPLLKGSYYLVSLWVYIVVIFFFSDKISNKDRIKSTGMKGAIFLTFSTIVIAIMTIGTVGYSVVERSNLPFFVAIKNITIFGTINRIEALAVTQWITSDFALIIVFAYSILCILKYLLNLSDIKSLTGIFAIFMYIFSLYISKSQFELQEFSINVAIHLNFIFGLILPMALYVIGKLRKKI